METSYAARMSIGTYATHVLHCCKLTALTALLTWQCYCSALVDGMDHVKQTRDQYEARKPFQYSFGV